jgi:3-hydroxybutyryl-CoA dehydrogenase
MKVAVLANNDQWNELVQPDINIDYIRMKNPDEEIEADLYIILQDIPLYLSKQIEKPTLIHSVETTLKEWSAPSNVLRINAWKGFLARNIWEISGLLNHTVESYFTTISKEYTLVPDAPGFIVARIIAMIINEAYYTVGENVSSREEIDTAMKLGTNYPYGPFEWCELIGKENIYTLLNKMSRDEKRYSPAPLLESEIS